MTGRIPPTMPIALAAFPLALLSLSLWQPWLAIKFWLLGTAATCCLFADALEGEE